MHSNPNDELVARWKTLRELARLLGGYRTLEELFRDLNGALHHLLNFTYLSAVLHDPAEDAMRVWQIEGADMVPYPDRPAITIEESPSGEVWRTQQPLVISDTLAGGRFPMVENILANVNVRSFLSLPLTTVHRRLGALNFGNSQPSAYDGIDVELPLLVASHVAIAVDNALHADAARDLERSLRERNQQLTAEKRRLSEIVRELPGVVWELNGNPAPAARIAFLNDAACDLVGYRFFTGDTAALRVLALIERKDRYYLTQYILDVFAGKKKEALLVQCRRRDRSLRWLEIRCTVIRNEDGVITGLRGVSMDVTTRMQNEYERRQHLAQLVAERLQERSRIAADLHDTLLQSAIGSSLRLHSLSDYIAASAPPLQRDFEEVLGLLDQAVSEARTAVQDLRDAEHGEDIEETLQRTAALLHSAQPILFTLTTDGERPSLDGVISSAVKRICKEALTNAYRHAKASRVGVHIAYAESAIRVTIRDNGIGIDPRVALVGKNGHLGIMAMRERAEVLGGSLVISTIRNEGTAVALNLPASLHLPTLTAARDESAQ